jgi:hypothetical protein
MKPIFLDPSSDRRPTIDAGHLDFGCPEQQPFARLSPIICTDDALLDVENECLSGLEPSAKTRDGGDPSFETILEVAELRRFGRKGND